MSRKAKYVGGHRPGVEVTVHDEQGVPHIVTVEHNHELPEETDDGFAIPASVRDGLLEQKDEWSEVKRDTSPKGKGD